MDGLVEDWWLESQKAVILTWRDSLFRGKGMSWGQRRQFFAFHYVGELHLRLHIGQIRGHNLGLVGREDWIRASIFLRIWDSQRPLIAPSYFTDEAYKSRVVKIGWEPRCPAWVRILQTQRLGAQALESERCYGTGSASFWHYGLEQVASILCLSSHTCRVGTVIASNSRLNVVIKKSD